MKKALRFIIALLFAISVALVVFLPIVSVAGVSLAVKDLFMLAFNQIPGLESLGEVGVLVQSYISPFGYVILGWIALACLVIVLVMIFGGKKPYILSIFGVLALNGYIGGLVYFLYDKFQSIALGIAFYQLEGGLKLNWLPVILWIVINVAILVLAIIGIVLNGKASRAQKEILMPESYPGSVEERLKEGPVTPVQGPFAGALVGVRGQYEGMAYPLNHQTIYIGFDENGLYASSSAMENVLVSLRYDETRPEYQIKVNRLKTVQLASGQPLGARLYYLPRGSRIHFVDQNEDLILA